MTTNRDPTSLQNDARKSNPSLSERTPLLPVSAPAAPNASENIEEQHKSEHSSPRFFLFIQIALFCNVFLAGFDGTVTASTYASISSSFGTTIVNNDLIPTKHRGMYQALQNVIHGAGSIAGAAFGGVLTDAIGWRFCFLSQVPMSMTALLLAVCFAPKTETEAVADGRSRRLWQRLDLAGALLLFCGLVFQLAAMSLGTEMSWFHPYVIGLVLASFVAGIAFLLQESKCDVAPILPLHILWGRERVGMLLSNIALGVTAYGLLFLMPFFFQTVLLDQASSAGLRLIPASLATPLGGLITGLAMRRGIELNILTQTGLGLCLAGSLFILTLGMRDPGWRYSAVLIPGNLGSGMVYPSLLFSIIRASDKEEHAVSTSLAYLTRSMGTVWGVAAISTMTQSLLPNKLQAAFEGVKGGDKIVEKLCHSTSALRDMSLEHQLIAISAYYDVCRLGFYFILAMTCVANICIFFVASKRR